MPIIAYFDLVDVDMTPPDQHEAPTEALAVQLDVGENKRVATIVGSLPPPEGDASPEQRAHSILLKYLTDDARQQGMEDGSIELAEGCTEGDLMAELLKASEEPDCISPSPRKE